MNKKFIRLSWIVLPFFFCTSCEYELDKINYVEIEKPQSVDYKVQINAPTDGTGEYVIKYSLIKFDLELPENIYELYFRLYRGNDDNYDSFYVTRANPYASLSWFNPGEYTLKCDISLGSTNTGSLADISGYERYGKTFEWKIILQQNPNPTLNLRYERLTDTTFKLSWDKPDPDYGEIDYYRISDWWYDVLDTTTETSYVVTLSQWDNKEYYVRAYFKESYLSPLESYVYINNYLN
ncbi:MAG: fibronectin type III domain-containing protein [Candidatus Azobacteroides sp.]|nr:fibronectin type III domain-containing protein [Candidatus Azobacteroides sp.]